MEPEVAEAGENDCSVGRPGAGPAADDRGRASPATEDIFWYELVEGMLVQMSPPGGEHGVVDWRLGAPLGTFVDQHNLGYVLGAETGFTIESHPDTVLAPTWHSCGLSAPRIPIRPSGAAFRISRRDTSTVTRQGVRESSPRRMRRRRTTPLTQSGFLPDESEATPEG